MSFATTFNEGAFEPPSVSNSIQVKELHRLKEIALYCVTSPSGQARYRITRPIRHRSEIPTSILVDFISESEARANFLQLVRPYLTAVES